LRVLLGISRAIDAFTTLLGKAMFWLSLVMVAIGIINVVTRYVGRELGISLGGTLYITLQTYAYNLIFLLGAAYVLKVDGHVRVDILFSALRDRTKAWIDIVFTFLFLFPFCAMGIYLSQRYVMASWAQREVNLNAGGIPVYPIKTVIIVAFALLILQGVSEIIKRADFLRGGRPSMYQGHITEKTEAV
jgi:TRAP-type mannitol/chloroaromatic compound transport system permease small subunit